MVLPRAIAIVACILAGTVLTLAVEQVLDRAGLALALLAGAALALMRLMILS